MALERQFKLDGGRQISRQLQVSQVQVQVRSKVGDLREELGQLIVSLFCSVTRPRETEHGPDLPDESRNGCRVVVLL